MAQLYTTGPANIYVASEQNLTPQYLGTAEDAPDLEIVPTFEPVYNSLGGKVPFDQSYQGEVAMASIALSRFNEEVYAQIASRPDFDAGVRGTNNWGDIGTLMLTEGKGLWLWVEFPYVIKPAMADGLMPEGYLFWNAIPIGPDKLKRCGTQNRIVQVTFLCMRAYDPETAQFVLYDHDMSELPDLPPN